MKLFDTLLQGLRRSRPGPSGATPPRTTGGRREQSTDGAGPVPSPWTAREETDAIRIPAEARAAAARDAERPDRREAAPREPEHEAEPDPEPPAFHDPWRQSPRKREQSPDVSGEETVAEFRDPWAQRPAPSPDLSKEDDDLDRATEALFAPAPAAPRAAATPAPAGPGRVGTTEASGSDFDTQALRELFSGIASNHARPVKNLVFELRRGTAQKDWVELCRPVMTALIEGARKTGLAQAEARMTDFEAALALAASGTGPDVDPAARDMVLGCWEEMANALPEAFRHDEEERRREAIVIHSLLKQIPGVGHVTFVRLFGAGLTDLATLFLAVPNELTGTTGIPYALSERICERMQDYRERLETQSESGPEGERRNHLRALIAEFRRRHEEYERACSGAWDDLAAEDLKRRSRAARLNCSLEIDVLLADIGEVELAEQLAPLPFGARLEALERFVAARRA